jgi:hypothetical protein
MTLIRLTTIRLRTIRLTTIRSRTILASAVLAGLTLSTGCASSGDDDDAKAARAISNAIVTQQKSAQGPAALLAIKRKDADCVGKGLVDKLGTDKLKKYGVLTDDAKAKKEVTDVKMSAGDAATATDVLFGCVDVEARVEEAMAKSGTITPQLRTCVNRVLTEKTLRAVFSGVFQGRQGTPQRLVGPLTKCAVGNGG